MAEFNYFNYFTEIEEYFWQKRGAHLLVSPLDWAIVETWQKAGIPLSAVLKGIDRAFESYARSRRAGGRPPLEKPVLLRGRGSGGRGRRKGSCRGNGPGNGERNKSGRDILAGCLAQLSSQRNSERFAAASASSRGAQPELASRLDETRARLSELATLLDSPGVLDLEDLERRLTVTEEKLTAALTAAAPEEFLLEVRREMDRPTGALPPEDELRAVGAARTAIPAETALGAV